MDTGNLLKQEINTTMEDLHDFAKWKLIAVSSLAAAGLGLAQPVLQAKLFWLLVFVPYACAYVDLNCYQYLLRIFLIAKVLRKSADDQLLNAYEQQCETQRNKGFFGLGIFAQLGSSLAFSVVLPGFALPQFLRMSFVTSASAFGVWLLGTVSVIACYVSFGKKAALLTTD
jgi:hypothetical protein